MNDEWGPWIKHDGEYQPVADGVVVGIEFRQAPRNTRWINGNPDADFAEVWIWKKNGDIDDIIRYRIRKPKSLTILETILNELHVPAKKRNLHNESII